MASTAQQQHSKRIAEAVLDEATWIDQTDIRSLAEAHLRELDAAQARATKSDAVFNGVIAVIKFMERELDDETADRQMIAEIAIQALRKLL